MRHFMIVAALLIGQSVQADVRAVTCDGCSSQQKARAATGITSRGTVYVFDGASGETDKYEVFTEVIDAEPHTTWTQAVKVRAEWAVRRAWRDYHEAHGAAESPGVITLPGDFEVRSVAGAFLDPPYSTTAIEDYLRTLSEFIQLRNTASTLLAKLLQVNVGVVDVGNLVQNIVFNVEFPDGSNQDYQLSFSLNPVSGHARLELAPHGNAHAADGRPAPTSAAAFRDRIFRDRDGSLLEWIFWARHLGIPVKGRNGASMICYVVDDEIVCHVRQSN